MEPTIPASLSDSSPHVDPVGQRLGLLFGVSATDPLTFVVIASLLAFVTLLACYSVFHLQWWLLRQE